MGLVVTRCALQGMIFLCVTYACAYVLCRYLGVKWVAKGPSLAWRRLGAGAHTPPCMLRCPALKEGRKE